MRSAKLIGVVFVAVLAAGVAGAEELSDAQRLDRTVDEYYARSLQLNPLEATRLGVDRYNGMLPDLLSEESRDEVARLYRWCLSQLQQVDTAVLDQERRITWEVLQREATTGLQGLQHSSHLVPVSDSFACLPIFLPSLGSATSIQPFHTVADYEAFLDRLRAFPLWVERAIGNMRLGIEQGITQPRSAIERALPVLREEASRTGRGSNLYDPIERLPETIDAAEGRRLATAYRQVIAGQVAPAYARLYAFLSDEYLPHCRRSIVLAALPGGRDWYRHLVRLYTTTDLEPDEIFGIGLEEVDRVLTAIANLPPAA